MLAWKAWEFPHENHGILLRLHAPWFSRESMEFSPCFFHGFSMVFPCFQYQGWWGSGRTLLLFYYMLDCSLTSYLVICFCITNPFLTTGGSVRPQAVHDASCINILIYYTILSFPDLWKFCMGNGLPIPFR